MDVDKRKKETTVFDIKDARAYQTHPNFRSTYSRKNVFNALKPMESSTLYIESWGDFFETSSWEQSNMIC